MKFLFVALIISLSITANAVDDQIKGTLTIAGQEIQISADRFQLDESRDEIKLLEPIHTGYAYLAFRRADKICHAFGYEASNRWTITYKTRCGYWRGAFSPEKLTCSTSEVIATFQTISCFKN